MIDVAATYDKYRLPNPSLAEGVIYFIHEFGVPQLGYVGRTRNWRARKEVHFDATEGTSYFARSVRRRGKCLVFRKLEIVSPSDRDSDREWYWMARLQSEGVTLANKNKPNPEDRAEIEATIRDSYRRGHTYGQTINRAIGYRGSRTLVEETYAELLEAGRIQYIPTKAKQGKYQPTARMLRATAGGVQ